MYLIQLGPVVYERRGGGGFTLPEALHEVYGVRGALIRRLSDFSVAVRHAGSSVELVHVDRRGEELGVLRRKVRA